MKRFLSIFVPILLITLSAQIMISCSKKERAKTEQTTIEKNRELSPVPDSLSVPDTLAVPDTTEMIE